MPLPEFFFDDLVWYPDPDDPAGFYYRPVEPTAERDPAGRPVLHLWLTDQDARLQLGVQWGAEATTLDKLQVEIGLRYPERRLTPGALRLMPLPANVEGVTLAVGDGSGCFRDLQTVHSSGYPPYNALLNVLLTSEQGSRVVGALHGNTGYLRVTYRGTISSASGGTESLLISADLGRWFPDGGSEHIHVVGPTGEGLHG